MSTDFEKALEEKAKELYYMCDTKQKGFITLTEMEGLVKYLPLNYAQLEDVFNSLDDDKNGQLTLEEFTQGFGQFIGGGRPRRHTSTEDSDEGIYEHQDVDGSNEDEQFNISMSHIGAAEMFNGIDSVKELWNKLRKNNPDLLMGFETLMHKVSMEITKTQADYKSMEDTMKSRFTAHDEEIKKLYEDTENQIRIEREKLLAEERIKEKQLRQELEREIAEKDRQYQDISARQKQMQKRLEELNTVQMETALENERLAREKEELEIQLEETQDQLDESHQSIEQLRKTFKEDRRKRAESTMAISEGIAKEREDLVRQLDKLRDLNKKLKDERDEGILKSGSFLGGAVGEVIHMADGRRPLAKSDMAKGMDHLNMESAGIMRSGSFDEDIEFDEMDEEIPESACHKALVSAVLSRTRSPQVTVSNRGVVTDVLMSSKREKSKTKSKTLPERHPPDGDSDGSSLIKTVLPSCTKPERIFKIVFVGDSNVGKTTIIRRICDGHFSDMHGATIGVDYQIKTMQVDNSTIALQIWDTAGQEKFRSVTKQYYRKADGVIVVYDVTSVQSFLNIRNWMSCIEEGTESGTTFLLFANKIDLREEKGVTKCVSTKEGLELAQEYNAVFYEVSAKSGHNVQEAIDELSSLLKGKEDQEMSGTVQLDSRNKKKSGCCMKK